MSLEKPLAVVIVDWVGGENIQIINPLGVFPTKVLHSRFLAESFNNLLNEE